MKTNIIITLATLALASFNGQAATIGTEFTYQGRLTDATGTPSGSYDFTFSLHLAASGGVPIVTVTNLNTAVSNGLFTATVDFGGGIYNGNAYWISLGVRSNGAGGSFTALTPRQPITSTPYALYALNGAPGPQGPAGPPGAEGLNWRGAWTAPTSYAVDDAVSHNGSAWVAPAANTGSTPAAGNSNWSLLAQKGDSGATGPQGPQGLTGAQGLQGPIGATGPQGSTGLAGAAGLAGPQGPTGSPGAEGLNWRGAWTALTSYAVDDAVSHNGSAWVAPAANTGSTPAAGNSNWSLLAQKGDSGATGPQGPQGLTGAQGLQGSTGATGPQGPTGLTGAAGLAGPQGPPGSADAWSRTGNAGTTPGVNFLGTTDNQSLELRANSQPGLRLDPGATAANLSAPGNLSFGTQIRQMLNLWGTQYGIGVQGYTMYSRADFGAGFAWYQGGTHSDAVGDAGGGQTLMSLDSSGASLQGNLKFGTSSLRQMLDLNSGEHGIGVQAWTTYFRTIGGGANGGFAWYQGGVHANNQFDSGGGQTLMNLDSSGLNVVGKVAYTGQLSKLDVAENFEARVRSADFFLGHSGRRGAPGRALVDNTDTLHLNFASDWANTYIGGANVSVCTLTIRGGCDLAEPFQMSGKDLPKGAVVVIDETNPGHLKLSESAYDTRVAGIISGANGVNTGVTLTQEGVMEGDQNVALSGRVYVQAHAANGPIKPGDLLTTSDVPGHAMKVTDHAKAQGAILGKAMTNLAQDKGLVLVLVTLQ